MEELAFSHLTCDQLVERIAISLENSLNPEESAYAMLLGSGFSFPLVPTGREMDAVNTVDTHPDGRRA